MFRILLDQAYPYCLMRALRTSFQPDYASCAATESQRLLAHSASTLNLKVIHASLRSPLNSDEEIERSVLDDAYVYAREADLSISRVSSEDLCDILTHWQHV